MGMRRFSASSITYKLRILLFLLIVMPVLVTGYMVSQYLTYNGAKSLDIFRLNSILIFAIILSISGFLLVKSLLDPFQKLAQWVREIRKGNAQANFFEKRDDEIGELFVFFEELAKRLRKDYELVKELSITDELTGLYNYRWFQRCLSEEISRAKRYGRELSLVMFDLDHFKMFNDSFGHLAGDLALKKVAELLKGYSRSSDIICRYGGEEFMVILPEGKSGQALTYAHRICEIVAREAFLHPDKKIGRLTISAGITQYFPYQDKNELVSRVDKALYQAKLNGRNQVVMSEELAMNLKEG